jgi:purine-binding chemotaxis protein CheW
MAKQNQHAKRKVNPAATGTGDSAAAGTAEAHIVVFQVAEGKFGFQLEDISEVVRLPRLARMPLAPPSLLGLANLHGAVLPIVEMRSLLGLPKGPPDDAMRVIVVNRGNPVGFVVDRIQSLLAFPAEHIENDDAGAGSIDPRLLVGVIKGAEGESTIKILSPQELLRDEFNQLGVSGRRNTTGMSTLAATVVPAASVSDRKVSLLSFELGRQEYALPLDRVREIIRLPDNVSEVARSETAVLGVVTLRDRLLPLISLRALLGMPPDSGRDDPGKVVVLPMGNGAVGIVADRTREILHLDPAAIDPAPTLLTRGEGDAEITSICRLDHGKRLVAVLSPDRLFRSDLVRRILSEQAGPEDDATDQTDGNAMDEEQFVIFMLGGQEYGVPITAVDEIARVPEQIARLPRAPAFVDGVMNLRGTIVPIIDLRRRFDIASTGSGARQRILVLALGGGKTGFVVDAVSDVMRLPASAIRPAPEVSSEQMRLIGRVANLDAQSRMILLIDAAQLLDRIETEMLAKFDPARSEQETKAS